ncbi:hypothetical protein HZS61_001616 [Fusarium oxysporum f. sp. conglutinans]|uniref:Transcription factor domain-containing protein n=1 Tax=Fusarium oxysporum f. sp. conglutinans TaxID=100902 RepID=A0A8H6H5W3_FUSOX|nr:hypothetical protein HZS61_001616 [Fusarium oxysporum f. sp. conglutinans]
MQSLHSSRVSPHPLDMSQNNDTDVMAIAVEARTYWACFIMDCTINSGTYNPRMLPMSEMHKLKVPRPLNYTDFAFGFDAASLDHICTDQNDSELITLIQKSNRRRRTLPRKIKSRF